MKIVKITENVQNMINDDIQGYSLEQLEDLVQAVDTDIQNAKSTSPLMLKIKSKARGVSESEYMRETLEFLANRKKMFLDRINAIKGGI